MEVTHAVGSGVQGSRVACRDVGGVRARRGAHRRLGTTRWLGVIAAATYFVAGILISEVWFGWATGEDLQPNIDGLSFDEVLLLAPLAGIVSILVTRYVAGRLRRHHADETRHPPGTVSHHHGA